MRLLVTLLAVAVGLIFAFAMLNKSDSARRQHQPIPVAPVSQAESPPALPAETEAVPTPVQVEVTPPPATQRQEAEVEPIQGLHVLAPVSKTTPHIGSDDPTSGAKMRVDFTRWGAGITQFTLGEFKKEVDQPDKYVLAHTLTAGLKKEFTVYPYSARAVIINGQVINLSTAAWSADPVDRDAPSSATFRLVIGDELDQPVLEIVRRFVLRADSYEMRLEQRLSNRSDKPLEVIWQQYAQGDVVDDGSVYLGDRRKFVSGYFSPTDRAHVNIYTDKAFLGRLNVIKDYLGAQKDQLKPQGVWPNPKAVGAELVWLASTNRYFTIATHPALAHAMQTTADVPALEKMFPHIRTTVFPDLRQWPGAGPEQRAVIFELDSDTITILARRSVSLDIGIYAGPRDTQVFNAFRGNILSLSQLVRYELGCIWCTFQPLAKGLLWFLTFLHNWVVFDWGIAIIILVAVVRLLLHPITRRAQINMMKMGKQMQTLQPEMDKLKKKYEDDKQKLSQETMKLYREKGVNPANVLGCLPMLLQMPIWIALYAMLYLAIELRHEPAFYGIFQTISAGAWPFLADLSSPDRFIPILQNPVDFSLIFIKFDYSSINVLPLLMAVVFFIQQKFTTPPAATEQARQQQKMMKFMVLLFPLMLYSAPSGLTLYILASTTAGIVDSYLVRKHVKEQEEAGTLFDKKPRKTNGFMARMQKAMEEKQKKLTASHKSAGQTGSQRRKRKKP